MPHGLITLITSSSSYSSTSTSFLYIPRQSSGHSVNTDTVNGNMRWRQRLWSGCQISKGRGKVHSRIGHEVPEGD
jgi:hypothetical protein